MERLIPQSIYARNVLTLMTGTTLAQVIPLAISPILTRLYSPDEFGRFALYMSVITIASVLVTGRYELAILLPYQDRNALHLTALSMALSIIMSVVLLLIVLFYAIPIATMLGDAELAPSMYWVPLATLLLGLYQSLNYWSNRQAHYKRMAIGRTLQSSSATLAQLGAGYAGSGVLGLVSGQITGQVVAASLLARLIWREEQGLIRTLRPLRSLALAKKYVDFPKYLIIAHGFNATSGQMPVLLLGALFNASTVGLFSLTQRVMSAPMSLVAAAIGDVFRQEASQAYIQEGNCKTIYQRTFIRLLVVALVPFSAFYFLSPMLFAWVFGERWRVAGEYAQILTPMLFMQFITSPLSAMFMIAEKQRLDLIWQMILLALVIGSFILGALANGVTETLQIFTVAYCLAYVVNGLMSYSFAKNNRGK